MSKLDFTKSKSAIPISERQHRYYGKRLKNKAAKAFRAWRRTLPDYERQKLDE